jgi:hypothetical protein
VVRDAGARFRVAWRSPLCRSIQRTIPCKNNPRLVHSYVGTLLAAGFWASWRSGSFAAAAVAGVVTAGLAAILSITGAAVLLAIWHDPQTMAAIRGSGGLEEVFSLPLMMALPGVFLGSVGGAACTAIKRLLLTPSK